MTGTKVTADTIRAMKARGEKIAALTAYDFPMTRLLDEAGIPLILVGDSLGMVVLGYPDTTHVTMAEMEHHVRAAARGPNRARCWRRTCPISSYETVADAVANAKRLVAAGAEASRPRAGARFCEQVARDRRQRAFPSWAISACCRSTCSRRAATTSKARASRNTRRCWRTPRRWPQAGAFAVVLELVTPRVAKELTQQIPIPTIGIGAGPDCDGQILVTPDLLGMLPWFTPRST